MESMEGLRDAIRRHAAGDEVELKVIRKGKRVEKKVKLGAVPAALPGILPIGPNGNGPGQVQLRLQNLRFQGNGQLEFGVNAGRASVKMKDADGSVEMKTKDDAREVVVRDQKGEIEYEGPCDTPQDKAAAPPELRKRIEALGGIFDGGGGDGGVRMEIVPADRPEPDNDE